MPNHVSSASESARQCINNVALQNCRKFVLNMIYNVASVATHNFRYQSLSVHRNSPRGFCCERNPFTHGLTHHWLSLSVGQVSFSYRDCQSHLCPWQGQWESTQPPLSMAGSAGECPPQVPLEKGKNFTFLFKIPGFYL